MTVTKTLFIPNVSCNHCVMRVTKATADLPGVTSVEVDVNTKQATFTLESEEALSQVRKTLQDIGYPAE